MVYIQRREGRNLGTVDEFTTYKETRAMLKEYRMADPNAHHYISSRARCAVQLAQAEEKSRQGGYSFEWQIDPDVTAADWSDDMDHSTWFCTMYNDEGEHVSSRGGIDFGPSGSPYGDNYRRVIEAELASEIE
jgi:hypothetical protein